MLNINFSWLILIAICLSNCTYTILKHRSNELVEIVGEQLEIMNDEYTPPIIIEPVIISPTPPKIPIKPGPPIKPDPIINEPIKEITQPDTENSSNKRNFDKRKSSDKTKWKNSIKREEKRNR